MSATADLSPGFYRQLRDLDGGGIDDGHLTAVHELVCGQLRNGSFKSLVTRQLHNVDGNKLLQAK